MEGSVDVAGVAGSLARDSRLGPELRGSFHSAPHPERLRDLRRPLSASVQAALDASGAGRLWSHQAEALDAVRDGGNVLITTPTASGKSLVYQLAVLEAAARGEAGRALFLFPLKALGRDQQERFVVLAASAGVAEEASCAVYDGDTPSGERQRLRRDPPRVLVTNPDMLHLAILGFPHNWRELFGDLRWVVLDELHAYRGLFGAHLHHVLRRLMRLCRHHGSDPRFIASSATAANAGEFADALTGESFRWIDDSGAPGRGRHLLLFDPATIPHTTALRLLIHLLDAGLKTIVFTKARRITELLYAWLQRQRPDLAERVASYRSGFLPEERRAIEEALFSGRLDGVIATSALEMGIDVGGLDACVLVGYPGSIMSTWQRSGRAGRGSRDSLTALVALPDALDQYLLEHPEVLLESPCERLVVDPDNEKVVAQHLVCAAAELPLDRRRDHRLLERHAPVVGDLLRRHELRQVEDSGELTSARRRPHRRVDLRGSGGTFLIRDGSSGALIGSIDAVRARFECHPGAIYLHAGRQYRVDELDLDRALAGVTEVREEYYTTPLTSKETTILELLDERPDGTPAAAVGRLLVREQVVGFERRQIASRELLGRYDLDLPPTEFETEGLWWLVPAALSSALRDGGLDVMGSMHAAEHTSISLAPLVAVCDRGDVGGISVPRHPQLDGGVVFVYDGHAGGIGIARRLFDSLPELLERAHDRIAGCPCESGCPACIQSPKCGNGNRPLDKAGAVRMLEMLREGGGAPASSVSLGAQRQPSSGEANRPTDVGQSAGSVDREPGPPARPPAAPGRSSGRRTLLFDLETRRSAAEVGGWGQAHRMGLAVAVVLELETGTFHTYREESVSQLVDALEGATLVVGFNIRRFDYRVLAGYTGIEYGSRLPTLDLLEEVHRSLGFRLSLDHLARTTLGVGKSADGLQSLEWVRQGRLDLVEEYCRRDVEILRDLYLFGRREGHVLYRDRDERTIRLPVSW